jgi:hypothetical protein
MQARDQRESRETPRPRAPAPRATLSQGQHRGADLHPSYLGRRGRLLVMRA